jgi:hypothetical protein
MSGQFEGVLDLTTADTRGFEALESGTYDSELFEYKWAETKGEGKVGVAPLLKVQFKVIEPEYDNRRLFDQFVIPPADYDAEKRDKMLGMLVRFLVAMGLDEADIKNKKFKLNEALDGLVGQPVKVVARKKQKYNTKPEEKLFDNEVVGYKSASESGATARVL